MKNWTIRRALPPDAGPLTLCIEDAYSVYAERELKLPPVSEGIADEIRDNLVWVAVADNAIVGSMVLIVQKDHLKLANIAVASGSAGSGLGRALLARAEQEAAARGFDRLTLTTHAGIPENIRFYQHLGWSRTGARGSKVFMEKLIKGGAQGA